MRPQDQHRSPPVTGVEDDAPAPASPGMPLPAASAEANDNPSPEIGYRVDAPRG